MTEPRDRPFVRYTGGGLEPLGTPKSGDGTARRGYGLPVFAECGYACAYCGFDMGGDYHAWLNLSVDHVIPEHLTKVGWSQGWLRDRANLVTCCRACNEFLNGSRLTDTAAPASFAGFVAIRDAVFDQKLARAANRHQLERERFALGRPTGPTEAQEELAQDSRLAVEPGA